MRTQMVQLLEDLWFTIRTDRRFEDYYVLPACDTGPPPIQQWINVTGVRPFLNQGWSVMSSLIMGIICMCYFCDPLHFLGVRTHHIRGCVHIALSIYWGNKREILTQWWVNVSPPFTTLTQHWPIIGSLFIWKRVSELLIRLGQER